MIFIKGSDRMTVTVTDKLVWIANITTRKIM